MAIAADQHFEVFWPGRMFSSLSFSLQASYAGLVIKFIAFGTALRVLLYLKFEAMDDLSLDDLLNGLQTAQQKKSMVSYVLFPQRLYYTRYCLKGM